MGFSEGKFLEGKTAVITGGASGIGFATAELFVKLGARVAILDNKDIQESKDKLNKYGEILGVETDISNESQVERAFRKASVFFDTAPDTLVNIAGITQPKTPTAEMELSLWQKILNTNLTGPFLVTREFLRLFQNNELPGGSITTITSIHGHFETEGFSAYDASKSGLEGFMKSLVIPCGRLGIRVNTLAPGAIDPTGISQMSQEDIKKTSQKIPLGRVGAPLDVAHSIAFLASDFASYISGTCLVVDGGILKKSALL